MQGTDLCMEDTVYRRMHPHGSVEEKTAYVLLGKFENCMGRRECTFVEAVIPLNEILFVGHSGLGRSRGRTYISS